jgi:UDP-arabinose 4-epimerase
MKAVLVTGGAGYVGSHACKALAAAGYLPVAFDNLVRGHRWAVRWGPFVQGDIRDRAALESALDAHKPVAVMHFAAFAYVGESMTDPAKYYGNNVAGTLTLLEAMHSRAVGQMVFSSSCATYGHPQSPRIAEDHPQNPINPYGASKLMAEQMLHDFGAAHGLRSIRLRYFNAAGADPSGEIGECHEPETHLIPLLLDAAAGVGPEVTIFGDQHGTPDGTCIRDYVHVSDIADAHVLALQALQGGHAGRAYNLGNGQGFSVASVVDIVRSETGRALTPKMGASRPGDPGCLVGDSSAIRKELGWRPRYPDLPTIVRTAWQWHRRPADPVVLA